MLEMGPTGQEAGVRWGGVKEVLLGVGLEQRHEGWPLLTDRIAEATVLGMLMGRYQHLEPRESLDPHVRFFWLSS